MKRIFASSLFFGALSVVGLAVGIATLTHATPARAEDHGQYNVVEENDSIFYHTDKHYTQGLRFSYLEPEDNKNPAFGWFGDYLFPSAAQSTSRHVDWSFGQSIFTPTNLSSNTADPRDRPYAGWTYVGGELLQDRDHNRLDDLELQVGMVGPASLAEEVQNNWHQYTVHIATAMGWDHQIRDEPGLDVLYDRKWRLFCCEAGQGLGFDVIPDAGVALGNVMTYANAGTMARLGYNLTADYGPARIQPGQNGTDYYNPDPSLGLLGGYVYVGGEGRAVARNIFLDGNTFVDSAHIDKVPLVGDFSYGAVLLVGKWVRLTASSTLRSKEFVEQSGPDRFATVSMSVHYDW